MNFDFAEIPAFVHFATKRTGSPLHDEDLEQEIALNAIEASRRIDEVANPRALLMKIVLDTVHDHWRRRRPAEDIDSVDERFLAHAPSFESDLDAQRQLDILRLAHARLPAAKRAIIELFYTHDYSIPEIAALEDKSVSAVKMELVRSRRSLGRIVRSLGKAKLPVRATR